MMYGVLNYFVEKVVCLASINYSLIHTLKMLGSVLETDALVLTACARTAESNPYDNFMFT